MLPLLGDFQICSDFTFNAVLANVFLINLRHLRLLFQIDNVHSLLGSFIRSLSRSVGRQSQRNRKIGHIDLKCDTLAGVAAFRMDTWIQMICFRARTGRWHHIDTCNCNRFCFHYIYSNFWHPTENVISIVKSQFMPVDRSDKFNCRLILFPFCDDDDDVDDDGNSTAVCMRLV